MLYEPNKSENGLLDRGAPLLFFLFNAFTTLETLFGTILLDIGIGKVFGALKGVKVPQFDNLIDPLPKTIFFFLEKNKTTVLLPDE